MLILPLLLLFTLYRGSRQYLRMLPGFDTELLEQGTEVKSKQTKTKQTKVWMVWKKIDSGFRVNPFRNGYCSGALSKAQINCIWLYHNIHARSWQSDARFLYKDFKNCFTICHLPECLRKWVVSMKTYTKINLFMVPHLFCFYFCFICWSRLTLLPLWKLDKRQIKLLWSLLVIFQNGHELHTNFQQLLHNSLTIMSPPFWNAH